MLLVRLTFVMLLLTFMTTLSPVLCTLSLHDALPICGGSIAWRDDIGALKVGPQSAGADPGPICYRGGGTEPTITDANVVLGRLDPDNFLGGTMKLDAEAARRGIKQKHADPLKPGGTV